MARTFYFALLVSAAMIAAVPARAVEVSLEENKVAKGSVGYVDMRLLFKLFPETQKAKQSFEEAVRQAEEQINLRRAEILGIRGEISRLKAEREFAVRSSSAPILNLGSSPAPLPAPVPVTKPNAAPNIPGMAEVTTSTAPIVAVSTSAAPVPSVVATSSTPAAGGPESGARLAELDRAIEGKSKLLQTKEADFKTFEAQAEKSLLDLEGRKTEILLGRIYAAIQDVAKLENVSVVVDKTQILFGHKAVDLTDRVVQKLKSENP